MIKAVEPAPAPLIAAAGLVFVETIVLVAVGIVEVASFDSGRMELGVTTTIFFFLYAAGLAWCAWSTTRGESWGRAPIVLAQFIQLGVAWSFREDPTTLIAVALAIVAAVVLAGVFHPASIHFLEPEQPQA